MNDIIQRLSYAGFNLVDIRIILDNKIMIDQISTLTKDQLLILVREQKFKAILD